MNRRVRPKRSPYRTRPQRSPYRVRPLPYAGAVASTDTLQRLSFVEIDLDSGTLYLSFVGANTPSIAYEDRVLDISPITRSMSIYTGAISYGDATVECTNRGQYFSRLLATEEFKMRAIRIKHGETSSLASAITIFTGRILNAKIVNKRFVISAVNTEYEQLGTKLSQFVPMVNKSNFSGVPAGQVPVMAPLVFGRLADVTGLAPASTPGGVAPSYLVDEAASPDPYIYLWAARPLGAEPSAGAITEIYKYLVHQGSATITTKAYNGTTYAVSAFASTQRDAARPNEMELTGNINGFTEDDNPASTPILNHVRALEYTLDVYGPFSSANFDAALQTIAKNAAAARGYADDATTQIPAPFGKIISDHNMTLNDVVKRANDSFGSRFYMTREGLFATTVLDDDPDPDPDFSVTDVNDIIAIAISKNDEIGTVFQVNHAYRYTSGRPGDPVGATAGYFERQPDFSIAGEKLRLGGIDIKKNLNLWDCRSTIHAYSVFLAEAELYKANAEWLDIDLVGRWYRWPDLNRFIGVTHWQGISETRNVVKGINKATDDFDRADNDALGSGWTESAFDAAIIKVLSNQLRMGRTANTASYLAIAYRTESFSSTQLARIRWTAKAWSAVGQHSAFHFGIAVRAQGTNSSFMGFAVGVRDGELILRRYAGSGNVNSFTNLGSVPADGVQGSKFDVGDTLELRVREVGASARLEVWVISDDPDRNGLAIGPVDATTISGGTPGVFCGNQSSATLGAADFDDFTTREDWVAYDVSGYQDVSARITQVVYQLRPTDARIQVRAFRRPSFTKATDDFNRADSLLLGTGWTETDPGTDPQAVINIASNRLNLGPATNMSEHAAWAYRTESFGKNQIARMKWIAKSWAAGSSHSTFWFGLTVRMTGDSSNFNCFAVMVNNGLLKLCKYIGTPIHCDQAVVLTTTAADAAVGSKFKPGDMIELRVEDDDGDAILEVWVISEDPSRNGRVLGPYTEAATTITTGAPGVLCGINSLGTANVDVDDFVARDF